MKRRILSASGLGAIILVTAGLAFGAFQDPPGDAGTGPDGLVFGDANKPSGYIATVTLELRDIPNVGGGQLSPLGSRFLRVAARADDGAAVKMINFDYQCGEPAVADPCSFETICTPGKGNKEQCVLGQVVDVRKVAEIQAVVVSLLVPQIVFAYGLDPSTTLENTKLKGYVQTNFPVRDVDGVASFYSVADLAFAE